MRPLENGKVNEREDNYAGIYIGSVVKQCDDCGACKVFVYGVYPDEYKDQPDKLPTAYPCMPLWGGGRSENSEFPNGIYQYPDLNTSVLVFFASNDINRPYFFAMMDHDKMKYDQESISIYYGECYIKLKKGGDITIYANNNIDIEAKNNIDIKCGNNMTMTVGNDRTSKIANTDYTKTTTFGVAGDSVNLGAEFVKILTNDGYFGTAEGSGRVLVACGATDSGDGKCYVGPCVKVMEI